jgi:O-succinylbenzoic acid--CoA ligase
MNDTIQINGQILNYSSLRNKENSTPNAWEREIYQFAAWLTANDNTPMIFNTSGSTGTPKSILFSRKQVFESAQRTIRFFHLHNEQQFFLCLPATYVAGRMMIARAWASGANLITAMPSLNPFKNFLCPSKIDFAAFTPAQINAIIKEGYQSELEKIDTIIIGGSSVNIHLQSILLDMPNKIYQTYGMTESLTHVAIKKLSYPQDDCYRSISPDIYFSTSQENTLIVHVNNMKLFTNDQVKLLSPQSFIWLGRKDHVINSGGLKIHPEQIEASIIKAGILNENRFYVSACRDDQWGERPCLISLDEISQDQFNAINQILEKHHQIKSVIQVKEFKYTPSGKLIRKKYTDNY